VFAHDKGHLNERSLMKVSGLLFLPKWLDTILANLTTFIQNEHASHIVKEFLVQSHALKKDKTAESKEFYE
jgi:hypothetical protein